MTPVKLEPPAVRLHQVLLERDQLDDEIHAAMAAAAGDCLHKSKSLVEVIMQCVDCPMEEVHTTGVRRGHKELLDRRFWLNQQIRGALDEMSRVANCRHYNRIPICVWECTGCLMELVERPERPTRTASRSPIPT